MDEGLKKSRVGGVVAFFGLGTRYAEAWAGFIPWSNIARTETRSFYTNPDNTAMVEFLLPAPFTL